MDKSGLSEGEIKRIRKVFSKNSQIDRVILYGSRAIGNFEKSSDIDLTLIGDGIDLKMLSKIEFELDDLLLPYKFDINIFSKITNANLIEHIERVGIVFYEK